MNSVEEMRLALSKHGQEHLLRFWNELGEEERKTLENDINDIDLGQSVKFFHLVNERNDNQEKLNSLLEPVPAELCGSMARLPLSELEIYENEGLQQIANNRVGVLLLAGGQGTRLGFPHPKGMFCLDLPSKKSLFQIQAERIIKLQRLAQEKFSKPCVIPWYIMTSNATTKKTKEFFEEHKYFGLDEKNVCMFEQGMLPCFNFEGKILLESKSKVAKSPDGNGGLYKALEKNKILQDLEERKIKYLHAYCVDNILVKVADPIFIGYCVKREADCGAKVVEKVSPTEPIGVVCKVKKKFQVVEYSEISSENAMRRNPDNSLAFNAGNICNHFFTVEFLKKIANQYESQMKPHRAEKKIIYIDKDGNKIVPEKPNGVKIEKFVFDVIPFASKFVIWEVLRDEEFSALKNSLASVNDNPKTAAESLSNLHRKFIERVGGKVIGDGKCEISPLISYSGEGLNPLCCGKTFNCPVHME